MVPRRQALSNLRARVFVSCGQRPGRRDSVVVDELSVARLVGRELKAIGFVPYIATERQSLTGIVENVLFELRRSEYLVFLDFVRDVVKQPTGGAVGFRGSLFSHQELAIAAYLGLDILGFQDERLSPRDGFVRYVQGNVYPFRAKDLASLPKLVARQVRKRLQSGAWAVNWRRQLRIEADPPSTGPVNDELLGLPTRWFHLRLFNDHRTRHAFNAEIFATKVRKSPVGSWRELPPIPLKFDYLKPPTNTVPSLESRKFAAFRATITPAPQGVIAYNAHLIDNFAVNREFTLSGPANYVLRVEAIAEDFDRVRRDFLIKIGTTADRCLLRPIGPMELVGSP